MNNKEIDFKINRLIFEVIRNVVVGFECHTCLFDNPEKYEKIPLEERKCNYLFGKSGHTFEKSPFSLIRWLKEHKNHKIAFLPTGDSINTLRNNKHILSIIRGDDNE